MKFSERTGWDRTENELAPLLAEARASGTLVDLTESNPTRCGIFDTQALVAELGHPRGARYEPHATGHAAARAAVSAYYAARGRDVPAQRVVLSASTSESYGWLFKLLCDPGDEVLVPTPSYPLFSFLAELEGVTLTPFRLALDAGGVWRVDARSLAEAISPRTKAILLVHPNNPTGSFVTDADRRALVELAARLGVALVVDEVFADYAFDAARRAAPPTFAGTGAALTFVLSGLSKVVGLPQLKLGWIAASGPDGDVAEALARLELIADSYLSVSTPVQLALSALLAAEPAAGGAIRARTAENLATLDRLVAASDGLVARLPVDAGWYAIVDQRAVADEALVEVLAREDGVITHPGYFFDFEEACGRLVVSLLLRPDAFAAGVAAIVRRVRALSG